MPSLSVLVHICLLFFAGFTVYQVQENDFITSLRFIGQQTSERNLIETQTAKIPAYQETKAFRLTVFELPAPATKENKVPSFLALQNIRNESSLPRQDKVFPVQKYRVEEEWHKYCRVTRSITASIEDELLKTALSVDVKRPNHHFGDVIVSLIVVLGVGKLLIRIGCRIRIALFGALRMVWTEYFRPRIANLVPAFLQRADPPATSIKIKTVDLPQDASFLSLYHFLSPHYKITSKLGNGSFGTVYRAVHLESSEEVAIKFSMRSSCARSVLDEGRVMKKLQHDNILRAFHTYYVDESAALVMELMDGTLANLRGHMALKAEDLAGIFRQLLRGLDHMHQKNFIHRDIKSQNILFNRSGQVKIADFGLAVEDAPCLFGNGAGTVHWMAPEVLARQPYDKKADIWSLGVVLIELIDGRACYSEIKDKEEKFRTIMKYGAVSKTIQRFSNPYLEDFLSDMLTLDPSQRPSARDLLCHPFIQMFAKDDEEESHRC